jgi:TonB family protein
MSLILAFLLQLTFDAVPGTPSISTAKSYENPNAERIVCPLGTSKHTHADTYRELMAEERGRLAHAANTDVLHDPPKVRFIPGVTYPVPDWTAKLEGFVSIAILVDESGRATKMETVCATNERFEAEAKKAAAGIRYVPATQDGHSVPAVAIQPFRFDIPQ